MQCALGLQAEQKITRNNASTQRGRREAAAYKKGGERGRGAERGFETGGGATKIVCSTEEAKVVAARK